MKKLKIAAKDFAEDNGVTEESVINQIKEGKLKGRSFDGDWFVFQEGATTQKVTSNGVRTIEVKSNAGSIAFGIGFLGTLVWSFIGNVGSGFRSIPLYDAFTNDAIASANGFTAISPMPALFAIFILAIVVGAIFGLVIGAFAGKKTIHIPN